MSCRNPDHHTWIKQDGIHFAPSQQHNTTQAAPPSYDVCIHVSQGYCKFGNKCKKSHDLVTPPGQADSTAKNTEQLNMELRNLLVGFDHLDGISYADMLHGGKLDQFIKFINVHVMAIKQMLLFTPSKDVSQSLISHERVQNMAEYLDIWWKDITSGVRKPNDLYNATQSLDHFIKSANKKMAQDNASNPAYLQNGTPQLYQAKRSKKAATFADSPPQGHYSNVNYFQNDRPQLNQGNMIFQNSVSNNARGRNKKKGSARATNYANGDNPYNYWNNVVNNSPNFNPNIARTNALYKNNNHAVAEEEEGDATKIRKSRELGTTADSCLEPLARRPYCAHESSTPPQPP
jgi:hypothetical protein